MKGGGWVRKRTAMVLVGVMLLSGLGWVWTTHQSMMVAVVVMASCAGLVVASVRVLE